MCNARKYKLAPLTRKMNIVNELMNDPTLVEEVREHMRKYNAMLQELLQECLHKDYNQSLCEDDEKINKMMKQCGLSLKCAPSKLFFTVSQAG